MPRSYPAKVILFGEHTVLRGGAGLAVPYPRLALRWTQSQPDETLLRFCDYLKVAFSTRLLDTGALEDALLDDWRLVGDIPTGYGLGSSGAVCAAIWDRFATPQGKAASGEDLREHFIRMEQHFHGSSSGVDPLISYLDQPVILGDGQAPRAVALPTGWQEGFFLVDTGVPRKAAVFIDDFIRRYDGDGDFRQKADNEWRAPAAACIRALEGNDRKALLQNFRVLSAFQLRELPHFIPTGYHVKWFSNDYLLKICGAGGGGVLLGWGQSRPAVEAALGPVWWL